MVYFAKKRICFLGTVRRQRISNRKIFLESEIMKNVRRTVHKYVCDLDGTKRTLVISLDNKVVI